MKTAALVHLAFALSSAACNTDPAKNKARAKVSEAVTSAPGTAAGRVFAFSEAKSSIEFVGAKVTSRHAGKFEAFRGSIRLVDGDPSKSSVTVEIDAASLSTDDARLTRHLKSPDFFDVEKFPKARFTSTSIAAGGQDGATHTITGNLELHGVTKEIAFPAKIRALSEAVEATAEFAISRQDFGVAYAGVTGDLIRSEVLLMIQLRATRD
jgi:polyisoprenoid-binding protein YceI